MVYTIHATKKLLDRVRQPLSAATSDPATALGNWYATAIFWKPHVALFVNEPTLFPVIVPLTPAVSLAARFPNALADVLAALGVNPAFIAAETELMATVSYAKTANRSVVGIMNEFTFLANQWHQPGADLVALSLRLAATPCSPLYQRHIAPDDELRALVNTIT